MVDLAIENPHEAEIAAIVRTTIQAPESSSWSVQTGELRPFKEPTWNENPQPLSVDAGEQVQAVDASSDLATDKKKRA